jgi:hypothetical protein
MQFSIFAPAITRAPDQATSTVLDPGAKASHSNLARWSYMVMDEKTSGRDRVPGQSGAAIAYCLIRSGGLFISRHASASQLALPFLNIRCSRAFIDFA